VIILLSEHLIVNKQARGLQQCCPKTNLKYFEYNKYTTLRYFIHSPYNRIMINNYYLLSNIHIIHLPVLVLCHRLYKNKQYNYN